MNGVSLKSGARTLVIEKEGRYIREEIKREIDARISDSRGERGAEELKGRTGKRRGG